MAEVSTLAGMTEVAAVVALLLWAMGVSWLVVGLEAAVAEALEVGLRVRLDSRGGILVRGSDQLSADQSSR